MAQRNPVGASPRLAGGGWPVLGFVGVAVAGKSVFDAPDFAGFALAPFWRIIVTIAAPLAIAWILWAGLGL